MKQCDVIVIGAGIIGAACAWQLAKRGQSVTLIDDGQPGATAAGMGHLVCMDDDPAELALSAWSLERWRAITPRMPDHCAWRGCGTLWLAESEEEMAVAGEKQRRLAGHQVPSERQTPQQIAGREPLLRGGLAGGLWVPGDGIVYAPNVARWLMADAGDHLTCLHDSAQAITEPQVLLAIAGADARSRPPFRAGAGDVEYHPLLERPARRLAGWQPADRPASHAPWRMAGAGP